MLIKMNLFKADTTKFRIHLLTQILGNEAVIQLALT